ncbi:MAG: hypothetical protein KAI81_02365 [Candidatus Marinimicrobia bacterium]|nr:hypothetical protein [Candidatus Neomarinimicrobiota bacterium]
MQKITTLQEYSIWLKTYRKKISDDRWRDLLYTPFVIQVFEIEHQIMAHILHVLQREAGLLSLSIPIGENIDIKINENILKRRFRRILIPISEKDTVATARLNIEIFLKYIFFQTYNDGESWFGIDYFNIAEFFAEPKVLQFSSIPNILTTIQNKAINKEIRTGFLIINAKSEDKSFRLSDLAETLEINNFEGMFRISCSNTLPSGGIVIYES